MDLYRPSEWHDFFLTVAGGAAALTGLVVVAMSLHLDVIARDSALRHRARSVLFGLGAVFVRAALVLMGGQDHRAVAAEIFAVCLAAGVAGAASFTGVLRRGGGTPKVFLVRTVANTGFYLLEMGGASALFLGSGAGLYVIGIAIMANISLMITGAWLLLIGVSTDETAAAGSRPG